MTITASIDPDQPADESAIKRRERRALGVACGAHVLHDGYTDLIWVALPIWQTEFALSYAAVGLLRMIYSGTMASLQIPAAHIAERIAAEACWQLVQRYAAFAIASPESVMDFGRWWQRCFSVV